MNKSEREHTWQADHQISEVLPNKQAVPSAEVKEMAKNF